MAQLPRVRQSIVNILSHMTMFLYEYQLFIIGHEAASLQEALYMRNEILLYSNVK